MKIIEFHVIIMKIIENKIIYCENYENHENNITGNSWIFYDFHDSQIQF